MIDFMECETRTSLDYEPNFDDPEGYVDEISDEELLGDILRQKPKKPDTTNLGNLIIIDGIPQVNTQKLEKLENVLKKLLSKFGTIVTTYYPKDEKDVTKGFMFLEYSTPEAAQTAVKELNNYKLDKLHTFSVNLFTDFDKYENTSTEWTPPEAVPYQNQEDLYGYLLNPDACDQFSVTVGNGSNVQIWQNTHPEPEKIESRNNWTKTYVKWSPLGTFLCTFHDQGIVLRGGSSFNQYKKFPHINAKFLEFSPCEKYIVTYSPQTNSNDKKHKKIIIWNVKTGLEKRFFNFEGPQVWPVVRWSHDDKYFAIMGDEVLSVYESSTFFLLDKKSIKIAGLRDFSWSPSNNTIAYWVAENKDVPARVNILEIPNRIEIRSKNLFNVADCKLHWQNKGDYLCVKVDRYTKMRKDKDETKYFGLYYNFEIYHMREKLIPVDNVEIKDPIQTFCWEPLHSKFSIIHGGTNDISVSFYEVRVGQRPSLLKIFRKRSCSHLFWSPNGQFIVLAGLDSSSGGSLEFVDTNDFSILNSTEHYQVSDIEWDPTGRYVVTSVSTWKTKLDTGYWMWTFQGKILKRINLPHFSQLLWRPRFPSLLSEEQVGNIKKNLKKYYPQFERKDRMRKSRASKEVIKKRSELMRMFAVYRNKRIQDWHDKKFRRLELRNGIDTDSLNSDIKNLKEEVVEFFVNEEEVIE